MVAPPLAVVPVGNDRLYHLLRGYPLRPEEVSVVVRAHALAECEHSGQTEPISGCSLHGQAWAATSLALTELRFFRRDILVALLLHRFVQRSSVLNPTSVEEQFSAEVRQAMLLMQTMAKIGSTNPESGNIEPIFAAGCGRLQCIRSLRRRERTRIRLAFAEETVRDFNPLLSKAIARVGSVDKPAATQLGEWLFKEAPAYLAGR